METAHGQRALIFDFDTIQQRELWDRLSGRAAGGHERPPAAITQKFSGLLRTADVLTQSIVLPDVQLLDGALFLHHGPEMVRSLLGRSLHESLDIEIVGRDASLAECLRKMLLGSKESNTLGVFEFSSMAAFHLNPGKLAETVSKRASRRLKECPAAEVPTVVAAEFQAAHTDVEYIDAPTGVFLTLADRWDAWISAFDRDADSVRKWDTGGFSMEQAFLHRPTPAGIAPTAETADSLTAAVEVIQMIRGRSTMKARLKTLAPNLPLGASGLLDAWWSSAYFDALARQHRCSWIRLESSVQDIADMESSSAQGTMTVAFEGSLIGLFGEMPSPTFASAKYSARDAISNWAEAPVPRNSDALAFAILKFTETVDRQATRRSLWTQIILTLLPAVLGALIGQWVSVSAGIWTLVLTALTILLATPFSNLLDLYALRSKKMRTMINMPTGHHV